MKDMKINNGYTIPSVGYGTWQSPDSEITVNGVKTAISCGYHHIDTAAAYKNEESVGKGIKESSVPRENLSLDFRKSRTTSEDLKHLFESVLLPRVTAPPLLKDCNKS